MLLFLWKKLLFIILNLPGNFNVSADSGKMILPGSPLQ
jgi:hypothetical protein